MLEIRIGYGDMVSELMRIPMSASDSEAVKKILDEGKDVYKRQVLFGSGLMRTLLHDIMIRQKRTIKKCLSSGQNGDIL